MKCTSIVRKSKILIKQLKQLKKLKAVLPVNLITVLYFVWIGQFALIIATKYHFKLWKTERSKHR